MELTAIDTNKLKRAELIPLLTTAAVNIALKIGVKEQANGNAELGTHLMATFNGIAVSYRTPSAMIFSAPTAFGVDVWHGNKCFSVIWNSQVLKDYQIVNFKRGPWIPTLLSFAEQLDT